jgi:hypothetical protein
MVIDADCSQLDFEKASRLIEHAAYDHVSRRTILMTKPAEVFDTRELDAILEAQNVQEAAAQDQVEADRWGEQFPLLTSPVSQWKAYAATHENWVSDSGDRDDWRIEGDQLARDFGGSLPRTSVVGETTLWEKVSA